MRLEIHRQEENDKQTLGELFVIGDRDETILRLKTLELPDLNSNLASASCFRRKYLIWCS